jgi:nucleoside-diphosphate-sugar epimerase
MARILIVGGAGYVGGHLTDCLADHGHEVVIYDLLLYEDVYLKPVKFAYGDVLDRDRLLPYVQGSDVVIWLAALVGDGACALDEDLTLRINVDSVRWLTSVFGGPIIFTSTCSVYGAQDGWLTESSPLNPLSLYARTKLEAERVLSKHPNCVVFRLGTLYGIGDRFSRLRVDLVVNTLTVQATLNKKMTVFGGEQYRPLLHVRDVAGAVLLALDSGLTGIFDLTSENVTILQVAKAVQGHVPDAQIEVTELPYQDARNYRVSGTKARQELCFSPLLTMQDGITEVKALVEEGRIRDLTTSRFSNYAALRPFLHEHRSPLGREIYVSHQLAHQHRRASISNPN